MNYQKAYRKKVEGLKVSLGGVDGQDTARSQCWTMRRRHPGNPALSCMPHGSQRQCSIMRCLSNNCFFVVSDRTDIAANNECTAKEASKRPKEHYKGPCPKHGSRDANWRSRRFFVAAKDKAGGFICRRGRGGRSREEQHRTVALFLVEYSCNRPSVHNCTLQGIYHLCNGTVLSPMYDNCHVTCYAMLHDYSMRDIMNPCNYDDWLSLAGFLILSF